ncbi:type II toxin-antitoxin system Phd/YefM family antitoxin [Rhizobium leguminosarum]|uniref:type II toxin-antitoxin system Phd/YefM family antitoxin n=1 Tax=Rhizobium leguminosarum TaxID=384 RepID=UPI0015FA2EAF|nr:prevent-host-death family protein [Rhizobium leguminosarum]MBA9036222.1 antitoxin (DNA-binding transcriptional repressor) of toxin-antitoxin stability system [Rhizobium leguminosarum]
MKICVEIAEAAVRLDELIDLSWRDDEVAICRDGNPVAVIVAIPRTGHGTIDDFLALAAAARPAKSGRTANHEFGLPK